MNSKDRLITALEKGTPDRLPVTTHHLMDSFLQETMGGQNSDAFFRTFGMDPIRWIVAHRPANPDREYPDPGQEDIGFLEARRVASDQWRIRQESVPGQAFPTVRYTVETPGGTLSTVLQSNKHTTWVTEHLVKEPGDIDLIANYATSPVCDVKAINRAADDFGDRGLIRGHFCCFDIYGQPGCWQDAACLVGIENLILATFDDPDWVHALLGILLDRKLTFAHSLRGARYDLLELGGGDASSTVISPGLFDQFVAPYDQRIIEAAHHAGQRVVYHTCGGMMPLLERIADMQPDAMETFTPPAMGGDADLREAKTRIGDRVCMIGGFDQFHFFTDCPPEATRAEVRRCFQAAGQDGGFILSPSDHFFEAQPQLLHAFAEEARACLYDS
jgi:hypothetical protein